MRKAGGKSPLELYLEGKLELKNKRLLAEVRPTKEKASLPG